MRYELAVVVPTLNEAGNIEKLLKLLEEALSGIAWEVIFVDDNSSDGTAELCHRLAAGRPNVRCLRRIGRRGLSSACIEGMMATGAAYVAVMDADLQHDETLLPKMLELIKAEQLDVVVASRFLASSRLEQFSARRERLSRIGNALARFVSGAELTDPLSGFFLIRRDLVLEVAPALSGQGFKILLDLFASSDRQLRFKEVPFTFRQRHAGVSKLDTMVTLEFLMVLADKLFGRFVPVRFVIFVLVGLSGVAVHLLLLGFFFRIVGESFYWSQVAATVIAMTSNFFLNNKLTYRDRQLRGLEFFRGLASFYIACSIGALINFQVADFLYRAGIVWPLAGFFGSVVSSVWNYGVSSTFTWKALPKSITEQSLSAPAADTNPPPQPVASARQRS